MSRRRNVNKSDYTPLDRDSATFDTADGMIPEQFMEPKRKFPLKPVILVVTFMIVGAVCLGFSMLISAGYYDAKYQDRIWPLLVIGILTFIPGAYYSYILICILCKRNDFTYEDIPIF